jgi:hypothetical protein
MRYVLVAISILSITVCANAAMWIIVDGATDTINLIPSDTAFIGIVGDGLSPYGTYYLGILEGEPGSLDDSAMTITDPPGIIPPPWPPEPPPGWGSWIEITFYDPEPPPNMPMGKLVDDIIFLCEGPGDVTLRLMDSDLNQLSTQTVHQIPEPMTIALLGLGALALRRRK